MAPSLLIASPMPASARTRMPLKSSTLLGALPRPTNSLLGSSDDRYGMAFQPANSFTHQRMLVEGHVDLLLHVGVGDRQERQVERRVHRQLLRMVGGADVGHLQAADLQEVEQLLGLAEALVADLDLELAAGALVHELACSVSMFWVAARGLPQAASFHFTSGPSTIFAWANALPDHATTLAATTAATVTPLRRLMNAS